MAKYTCTDSGCKDSCVLFSIDEKCSPIQCPFSGVIDTIVFKKIEDAPDQLEESPEQADNKQSEPLEYEEWAARPCAHYDSCPVKNKNLHCYANKPCFI